MRIGIIVKIIGALLLLLGALTSIPLLLAWEEGEALFAWLWTAGTAACLGGLCMYAGRKADPQQDLGIREGVAITTLFWVCASLNAAVAIWLDVDGINFMQAWFECMSGLTTTGSSVFGAYIDEHNQDIGVHIESLPTSILFWRSALQWMGGIGIVVISIALIPLLVGGSGFQLYRAEIPGMSADRLTPRLRTTARILLMFYTGVTAAIAIALLCCGSSFFDAVCHAMCCISTGGFSTYDNSVEGLQSSAAEWVLIFGMLIGGINFSLLIQALRGKVISIWHSSETKTFFSLIIIAWSAISLLLVCQTHIYDGHLHDAFRDSLFQVVSISTSTGFGSGYSSHPQSWEAWPHAAILILVLLMFSGGCAGSTAGGMKLARVLVMFKTFRQEMRRFIEPKRVTNVAIDGHHITDRTLFQAHSFVFLFFITLGIGSLGFAILGHDVGTAFSATLTALSNIGPGISEIGPSMNFRGFDNMSLLLSISLMLIGRLELLTVLVTLHYRNWIR